MNGLLGGRAAVHSAQAVVLGIVVCVDAIGEQMSFILLSFGEEAEVDGQVASIPVGLSGNVPCIAEATCGNDIFAHLALQYACLVKYSGQ